MTDLSSLPIINSASRERAIEVLLDTWEASGRQEVVNFFYYSNFILMNRDEGYLESMKLSDFVLIDGIGMQLYLKVVKNLWPNNLNGTDLSPMLLKELDNRHIPIVFYGTTNESIQRAFSNVREYLENKSLYYYQNGFTPLDWDKVRPGSALFVGMGSPLQENWVKEHFEIIREKRLFVISIGGFFDFASGFYTRAPKWIRRLKLEWAHRTLLHPRRHLKKRFRDLTIIYRPFWDKLTHQGKKLSIREV